MIDFQNVSFSYGEESSGGGIRNVNLTINTGEFVLLTGESGCGKTTITRLVNGLVPHYYEGKLEGDVLLDGKSVSDTPLYDLAAMVGSVFQNPKSQFFNVDTDSELAFACENLGYPQEDILKRIDRTVSDYHIEDLMGRSVFALSGGEKQKIACASSSVLLPGIMVLDEPSSNLDMAAIDDLRQVLSLWKKQGKTILIAEHRLYYLHDLADRVLYVKDGEIEREYTPAEFDSLSDGTRKEMGLRPFSLSKLKPANQYQAHTAKQMEFQNFCFAYKKREPESLHIPSAELPVGETIAIIGLNGAGKSTLARCICGLEKKADYEESINTLSGEITELERDMDALDEQFVRYRTMEKDAKSLAKDHLLTAELIDRLIERIEIDHKRDIHVTFRFKSEFQGKEVESCANM